MAKQENESNGNALIGIENIRKHYPRSESTIMDLIFNAGFPAKKVNGRWESNKKSIDRWQQKRVEAVETKPRRQAKK